MGRQSPLSEMHEAAGAMVRAYGPEGLEAIGVVEAFDLVEPEYAALRKHSVMLDQPQRGTIVVRGSDRVAFLNRMVTQELKGMNAFEVRRSFWLNRKGRIDADLRLIELPEAMYIDLDYFSAVASGERSGAATALGAFVFSEDVRIEDESEAWHRVAMHGPAAMAVLHGRSEPKAGPLVFDLKPGQACIVCVSGQDVIVDRQDSAGEIGLELLVRREGAAAVYETLSALPDVAAREAGEGWTGRERGVARRVGWHAYNMARIETGWAMMYVDFGGTSLPHETGDETLNDRVSFRKGCYLGQEVVARMQSLGKPKQRLVGMRVAAGEAGVASEVGTGCAVVVESAGEREVVGAVTSATESPMLGGGIICFAMVKYKHTTPGTVLRVESGPGSPMMLSATVQGSLRSLKRM